MAAGNPEKKEIQFSDKEMDENQCNYRPFNCPYIECEDKLAADDVVSHVTSKHVDEFKKYDGPEITASMILTGPCFGGDGAWSPRMISCFGRTFFDVALTRDRSLHPHLPLTENRLKFFVPSNLTNNYENIYIW